MSIRSYSVLMTIWLVSSATGQITVPGTTETAPVQNIFELEELFVEQQYSFLPIAPPSEKIYLHSSSQIVPVAFDNFPKKFQNRIMAQFDESTGIPLYPITVEEDPVSRRTIFRNAFGVVIFQLEPEKNYNPFAWQEWKFDLTEGESLDPFTQWLYDPAHIAVSFTLIDSIYYESYLSEKEAQRLTSVSMQPMMMAMSVPLTKPIASMTTGSNGLVTLNISLPDTFGGYVEIFDRDWLQQWDDWELAKSWLPTYGNAEVDWEDAASSGKNHRFYYIGDATDDPEGDGYSTLREELLTDTDPAVFNMIDEDNDGMHDWWETKLFGGTNQLGSGDFDGDGLLNNEEMVYKTSGYGSPKVTMTTDPSLFDTDADGMDDGYEEFYYWLDPNNASDAGYDRDNDKLTNLDEYQIGTSPNYEDTDGDGLNDWGEHTFGLNPLQAISSELYVDSDGDGMTNIFEISYSYLDPFDPSDIDCDGDGLSNMVEIVSGTAMDNWDTDGDTFSDGYELMWLLDPLSPNAPSSDEDSDGLTLRQEFLYNTNPKLADTDGDGVSDSDEVAQGSSPSNSSDGGIAPPADELVELNAQISDSEHPYNRKYELLISGERNFRITYNTNFKIKRGETYTASIRFLGVQDGDPDYFSAPVRTSASNVLFNDPNFLLLGHGTALPTLYVPGQTAKIQPIKIETETIATQPADRSRKTLGVGEKMQIKLLPSDLPSVSWNVSTTAVGVAEGTLSSSTGNPVIYSATDHASTPAVTFAVGPHGWRLNHDIDLTVIEPSGIAVLGTVFPNTSEYGVGDAGAGMGIAVWLEPDTVSFYNVEVMEVGMVSTDANGYFTNTTVWPASYLDHSLQGANNPTKVEEDNYIDGGKDPVTGTRYPTDQANSGICPQPWSSGHFSWPIPAEWWVKGSSNRNPLPWSDQHFYIDPVGTVTIEKFNHTVTRETNNVYTVIQ